MRRRAIPPPIALQKTSSRPVGGQPVRSACEQGSERGSLTEQPTVAAEGKFDMARRKQPAPPPIVSIAEWQAARDQLLVREKAMTRALDALAAERRRLPMVRIEKDYVFEGPKGKARLRDMFE